MTDSKGVPRFQLRAGSGSGETFALASRDVTETGQFSLLDHRTFIELTTRTNPRIYVLRVLTILSVAILATNLYICNRTMGFVLLIRILFSSFSLLWKSSHLLSSLHSYCFSFLVTHCSMY